MFLQPPSPLEFQPRGFPRYDVQATAAYHTSQHAEQQCPIENLSLGGVCIRCDIPQEIGTLLHLVLQMPGHEPLALLGEVAWVNRALPIDIGVRFHALTETQRRALYQHLNEQY